MKAIYSTFVLLLIVVISVAQSPHFQRFNYQAVARQSGVLMTDASINVRFTIHQSTATGPVEYQETHAVTTNPYGMFNAVIGDGSATQGTILTIGSTTNILYLQVEINPGGGYVNMGASQIGSVPMANRALIVEFDQDDQSLSISGNQLSIQNANSVTLPSLWGANGSSINYSAGNVGIGTNSPAADLVVGSNSDDSWASPAITVGGIGESGGVVQIGNENTELVLEGGTLDNTQSRITASTSSGFGTGELLINAASLNVGGQAGQPSIYRLEIKTSPEEYGFVNYNTDGTDSWEQYVDYLGNLGFFASASYVGAFSPSSGAYTTVSDAKTKTDLHPMGSVLNSVLDLKPMRYEFIKNNPDHRKSLGFVAQDVMEIFPELVFENADREGDGTTLTMDYSGFGVIAIQAIQEQQTQIDELKKMIEALQVQVEQLSK